MSEEIQTPNEINMVVFKRIRAAVQSIQTASSVTVVAKSVTDSVKVVFSKMNSPYDSRKLARFEELSHREEYTIPEETMVITTDTHTLVISNRKIPDIEKRIPPRPVLWRGYSNVATKWVGAYIPLFVIEPALRRLYSNGFTFRLPFYRFVNVYTLLPKVTFDSDGKPVPVIAQNIEQEQEVHNS